MMQKNENRPGYKKTKLGEIARIYSGGTPSRIKPEYWNGDIPWVKTTQIQNCRISAADIDEFITEEGLKKSSAKMVLEGSILMAMYGQGKTRGQVGILEIDATINQACAAIELQPVADRDFIYQQLLFRYVSIRNMSNTGGQENLSSGLIKEIPVSLPPLVEQKAIAGVLSEWDRAISTTERLIQSKEKRFKWLMSTLINPTEKSGWKTVKLGDVSDQVRRKVGEKELVPFSISAGIGLVSQREKWGKNISGSQHKNYTHLKKGEVAYNKGNSKRYKQGCAYRLKDGEICVPNVFISFQPDEKQLNSEFVEFFFIANFHARQLKRYITSGARSDGLLNLNKADFFKIEIPLPPLPEQKEIAETLNLAQREINLLKKLAEKQKQQKRGLMQKLLTGEWRVKVKNIMEE